MLFLQRFERLRCRLARLRCAVRSKLLQHRGRSIPERGFDLANLRNVLGNGGFRESAGIAFAVSISFGSRSGDFLDSEFVKSASRREPVRMPFRILFQQIKEHNHQLPGAGRAGASFIPMATSPALLSVSSLHRAICPRSAARLDASEG